MRWKTGPNKVRKGIRMEDNQKILEYIVKCIEETGCNPWDQIKGYLSSGDERYITRNGDARRMINSIAISEMEQFIKSKLMKVSN